MKYSYLFHIFTNINAFITSVFLAGIISIFTSLFFQPHSFNPTSCAFLVNEEILCALYLSVYGRDAVFLVRIS